jgi:hypothetical protein
VPPRQSLAGQLGKWTGHGPAVTFCTPLPKHRELERSDHDHDILGTLPFGEILVIDDVSPFFRQRT